MPDGTAIVADASAATEGARYQLMLRPEAIAIAASASGFGGDGVQVLPGRVREASYLGAYSEYLVEVGYQRVLAALGGRFAGEFRRARKDLLDHVQVGVDANALAYGDWVRRAALMGVGDTLWAR